MKFTDVFLAIFISVCMHALFILTVEGKTAQVGDILLKWITSFI